MALIISTVWLMFHAVESTMVTPDFLAQVENHSWSFRICVSLSLSGPMRCEFLRTAVSTSGSSAASL